LAALTFVLLLALSAHGDEIDPTGIYLTDGGIRHLVIRQAAGGIFPVTGTMHFADGLISRAYFENEQLVIESQRNEEHAQEHGQWKVLLRFSPSRLQPGDWDLVAVKPESERHHRTDTDVHLPTPVPSFLHLVPDERIIEHFTLCSTANKEKAENRSALLRLSRNLAESYRDDLYVRALYLFELAMNNRFRELEIELGKWKEDFQKADNIDLRKRYDWASYMLRSYQLSEEGRNAWDLAASVVPFDVKKGLDERLEEFLTILNYDAYGSPTHPRFFQSQTFTKVCRVRAIFLLLQGEREKALQLLAANYHYGNLMHQGYNIIHSLIGIAIRNISTDGLTIYALNACETDDDFFALWDYLRKFPPTDNATIFRECSSLDDHMANREQGIVRNGVANAKLQLLKTATAARYRFVKSREFPKENSDFAPFLGGGPPRDPFSKSPIKSKTSRTSFVCYSVGPDGDDDLAAIEYDPANGTRSSGDIIQRVPARRRYPFPRNGLKVNSVREVIAQFPFGLPLDPFAENGEKPLTVGGFGNLYVYSYGPDTKDTWKGVPNPNPIKPTVIYDPTNGTTSDGDIVFRIPRR